MTAIDGKFPGAGMTETIGLRRAIGFWDLVLFGVISIAPVAPFTLFGFVHSASGGTVVAPYLLGAIGISLTALSYAAMAEIAPQAGSVYGFSRLAMGRFAGFFGGWAIMLDYVLIAALVLLYGALFLNSVLIAVPVELLIAAFGAAMLTVNLIGIHWSAWVDAILTGLQVTIGLLFAVVALGLLLGPGGAGISLDPLWSATTDLGAVVAGTSPAVIAFLGFDAISTLSEEVRGEQPGRLVGLATLSALVLMLGLFVGISWLLADLARGLTIADPSTASLEVLGARIGWLVMPLSLVVALAFWAGTTAGHAGVSRLGFAMARAGELPGFLAYVHPGRQVPTRTVLLYGALIVGIAYVALPHVTLLTDMVSFGAIVGFILVNLSVVVHFGVRGGSRRWFRHWLAPGAGIAVLLWVLSGIHPEALIAGTSWLAVGLLWFFAWRLVRARHPATEA